MIAARIGCDHFLVWTVPAEQAAALVPGLAPVTGERGAWLLCAAAEFTAWRLFGVPGLGRLRTAAWLVPSRLPDGTIGNAFVRRFVDHAVAPRGWALGGWTQASIHLSTEHVAVGGQAIASAGAVAPAPALAWFDQDRIGLLRGPHGWSRWPIAKQDWGWSFRQAALQSPVADGWGAQPYGLITVNRTLARWGQPVVMPGLRPGW